MKKKIVVFTIIFSLLLISVIFVNSCVQAFSKEEKLQINKEVLEQKEEREKQIYKNMEEVIQNCNNTCETNENCFMYQQNENCLNTNKQCLQKKCNGTRNYNRQQNCHHNKCNR